MKKFHSKQVLSIYDIIVLGVVNPVMHKMTNNELNILIIHISHLCTPEHIASLIINFYLYFRERNIEQRELPFASTLSKCDSQN